MGDTRSKSLLTMSGKEQENEIDYSGIREKINEEIEKICKISSQILVQLKIDKTKPMIMKATENIDKLNISRGELVDIEKINKRTVVIRTEKNERKIVKSYIIHNLIEQKKIV